MLWHYLQIVVIFGHLDQAFANDLFLLLSLLKSRFNILPHLLWQSCWTWDNDFFSHNVFFHFLNFNHVERYYLGKKNDQFTGVENWKVLMFRVYLSSIEKKSGFQKENWSKLFSFSIAPFSNFNNKQHTCTTK